MVVKIISFALIVLSIISNGCSKPPLKTVAINPEILGQWRSNDGCFLHLAQQHESLLLLSFTSPDNYQLRNLPLVITPHSILTKFNAKVAALFSAEFLEGVIMVNQHCQQPLHKVAN